jgi:chorismate mutase
VSDEPKSAPPPPSPPGAAPVVPELEQLRGQIDEVDRQILALVAERVRIVLRVGDIKRARNLDVYDPERERRLLARLTELAPAPLDATTVRRVFERLIDESRRLEQRHVTGTPEE